VRKTFNKLTLVLALIFIVVTLAACGTSTEETDNSTGEQSVENEWFPQIELTDKKITVLSQSDADNFASLSEILQETYGLEVDYVAVSWSDLGTKMAQLVLGGSPPEVYFSRTRDFPLIVNKNLVEPLDDIIDFSLPMFEECEAPLADCTVNGVRYAATTKGNIGHVIWYNEKLFKEAGLESPRKLFDEGRWDWNTFLEAAIELTDTNIGRYGAGGLRALDWWLTTGKDVLTYDEAGIPISLVRDPDIMEAMEFWRQLSVGKYKVYSPELTPVEQFKQGKIGMIIDGLWLARTQLAELSVKDEVNFVPMPKYPKADGFYTWGVYNALAIGKDAKNIEGAKAFIYTYLAMSNATDEQAEDEPILKAAKDKSRQEYIEHGGFNDEDFLMLKEMDQKVTPVFSIEKVSGYVDYVEWVICKKMRDDGSSWLTNLEIQEEWLDDMIDTYMIDVLGIKSESGEN
jgi:ABC-type glycerol-3-phosphate transport system substrate-binding protein